MLQNVTRKGAATHLDILGHWSRGFAVEGFGYQQSKWIAATSPTFKEDVKYRVAAPEYVKVVKSKYSSWYKWQEGTVYEVIKEGVWDSGLGEHLHSMYGGIGYRVKDHSSEDADSGCILLGDCVPATQKEVDRQHPALVEMTMKEIAALVGCLPWNLKIIEAR